MEEPAVAEFEPGSLPPVGMAPAVAGTATAAAATQGEDASASSSSPSKQHEEREAEAGERPPSSPTVEEGTAPDEDGGGASHVPAARGGGGSPGPRPPLQGTLIGPFVVLDPARQRSVVDRLVNVRRIYHCIHSNALYALTIRTPPPQTASASTFARSCRSGGCTSGTWKRTKRCSSPSNRWEPWSSHRAIPSRRI